MKKLLFCAAAATLLTACNNDETLNVNTNNEDLIRFSVTTENATRANIYCSENALEGFTVTAFDEDGDMIIKNDAYTKGEDGYTCPTLRYWPGNGKLTFWAIQNGTLDFTNKTAPTVAYAVSTNKDLVYAKSEGTKADGTVKLNFRHALSQVIFGAKLADNATANRLEVKVKGVEVCGVATDGTFTLPAALTTTKIAHGTGHAATDYSAVTPGTWAATGAANYGAALSDYTTVGTDGLAISTANSAEALLMIPKTYDDNDAVYFLVDCDIVQKGVAGNNEADVQVFKGKVKVPFTPTWDQGKRYLYTFVIGDGTGVDEDDNNIFVKIKFDVSVDEFVDETGNDLTLGK